MDIWLPIFFVAAMGLALLIYVILDGYDLGIGLLLPLAADEEKDVMIASIGPFWDANETWIVLGVGILLIAFPQAHGIVLSSLYLPVTLMLMGLILRGVAFDFRVKSGAGRKALWNRLFFRGSRLATLCQGWMIGAYITGLQGGSTGIFFSVLIAVTLPALYTMLGGAWLLMKAEGRLLRKAIHWCRVAVVPMGIALLLVSVATPVVSERIAAKWFSWPNLLYLSPIPLMSAAAWLGIAWMLTRPRPFIERHPWPIFAALAVIAVLATAGLGFSLFPDIIIGRLDIWQAAASTPSLLFSFVGTVITLPLILAYTVYIYRIFHGRAVQLSYE